MYLVQHLVVVVWVCVLCGHWYAIMRFGVHPKSGERTKMARGQKWEQQQKMGSAKKSGNSNARITYVVLQY